MKEINWTQITRVVKEVSIQIENSFWTPDVIVGIANGGVIPAMLLLNQMETIFEQKPEFRVFDLSQKKPFYFNYSRDYLVVDDIHDTGKTFKRVVDKIQTYIPKRFRFAFLYAREKIEGENFYVGQVLDHPHWLHFPWEK